jgi:nucleoside-diphosphate-sugar epimerase
LITGSGLIGAYVAQRALQGGDDVLLFDRHPDMRYVQAVTGQAVPLIEGDVRDVEAITAALRDYRPDVVVHTAGALEGNFRHDRFNSYTTNLLGGVCLAEAARRFSVRRLVLCSSLAVYDFAVKVPAISEDHPLGPETLYDHSKALAEAMLLPYCRAAGVELVVLRVAGIYGCGQFRGGAWMGPQIHALMLAARDRQEVELDGDQLGTNDCLYVKDAAQALALACTAPLDNGEVMNVGTGRLTSPQDIAAALQQVFPGAKIVLRLRNQKPDLGPTRGNGPLAIARAQYRLGYRPTYPDAYKGLADYALELRRLQDVLR